jgi:CHAD domain-containing protein
MGSNTKWIDSRPGESARHVARRALKRHLVRMWHYLELAVCESPNDTENVHQLRVFSRRASAVIDTFAACVPKKRGRSMLKHLRKVRKAAGAARDCDVLLLRWSDHMRRTPSSHTAVLVEQIRHYRYTVQPPIEKIHAKLTRKQFTRRASELLNRIHPARSKDTRVEKFACFSHVALKRVVVPYLQAAGRELDDAAAMHAFRIQSKQVRYGMEIFGGAFDEEFRKELYPMVESLQNRLGRINDHVTAQTYFAAWHAPSEPGAVRAALEAGIEREQEDLDASRRDFFDWWTQGRREDLCRRFQRYVDFQAADRPAEADSCDDVDGF